MGPAPERLSSAQEAPACVSSSEQGQRIARRLPGYLSRLLIPNSIWCKGAFHTDPWVWEDTRPHPATSSKVKVKEPRDFTRHSRLPKFASRTARSPHGGADITVPGGARDGRITRSRRCSGGFQIAHPPIDCGTRASLVGQRCDLRNCPQTMQLKSRMPSQRNMLIGRDRSLRDTKCFCPVAVHRVGERIADRPRGTPRCGAPMGKLP